MIWHVKSSETVLAVSANERAAAFAIAVDGMWGKTNNNVMCSANSAYASAETVNFISWCMDGETKLNILNYWQYGKLRPFLCQDRVTSGEITCHLAIMGIANVNR
jgi:hypothetical protein